MSDWHTRYRRIIDAYRAKLREVSPAACNEVDDKLWSAGEKWISDDTEIALDQLMTAREIAERFGLSVQNIRDWARRHPDRITTHKRGRQALYQLRQVLMYQASK